MRHAALILLLAASAVAASAQTPAKPVAKPATAAKPATSAAKPAATAAAVKLPPGLPVVKGIVKTAFVLRYQEISIGTGALAEPNKLYHVQYTGWLAADGHKFDSSFDHPAPVLDKDGKPVMGDDGKPKMGGPQPFTFPQGFGRVIPGWDQGFEGMKIGGKRRLFIPYQLAYGAHGHPTGDPKNPGIPPLADLIFDVELVDVTDMPPPTNHPGMGGTPGRPMPGGNAPRPSAPAAAATPAAPATPAKPATPASPATPTAPATQAAPTTPATPPQPK